MSKGKTTTIQEASLPAFQEQQFKELFGAARGVAQQPFIPYTGPMVAGFSPDQLRQFQATRGLFETGMQFDPTRGLQALAQEARPVTGPTPSLLGQDIGAYQSPYQQQVIDLAMQDIQRQADIARGGAQERAIRAGAFGGSRSALLEAESQRPYAEQMARTAAGLRQAGFEQAQRAAESRRCKTATNGIACTRIRVAWPCAASRLVRRFTTTTTNWSWFIRRYRRTTTSTTTKSYRCTKSRVPKSAWLWTTTN